MVLSEVDLESCPLDSKTCVTAVDPNYYQRYGFPHRLLTRLRHEMPVAWVEPSTIDPFWILTKQDDIRFVSINPALFSSAGRITINIEDENNTGVELGSVRSLPEQDPPLHQAHRNYHKPRFQMAAVLQKDKPFLEKIAKEMIDGLDVSGQVDFVRIVERYVLATIARILGVPEEHWADAFRYANAIAAVQDPDMMIADDPQQSLQMAKEGFAEIFLPLVESRMVEPKDDLTTVFLSAEIGGERLPLEQVMTNVILLFLGGVETSRNVIVQGLMTLVDKPEQWQRLRDNPALVTPASEEMIRWVSPINYFCRTATEDIVIRDRKIRSGDTVALFFPSGNRDENVFDNPFEFDVGRQPNPHIGFGVGEHACLGNALARIQIRTMFSELLPRLRRCEVIDFARQRTSSLTGVKSLYIGYELGAAANG